MSVLGTDAENKAYSLFKYSNKIHFNIFWFIISTDIFFLLTFVVLVFMLGISPHACQAGAVLIFYFDHPS